MNKLRKDLSLKQRSQQFLHIGHQTPIAQIYTRLKRTTALLSAYLQTKTKITSNHHSAQVFAKSPSSICIKTNRRCTKLPIKNINTTV